MNTPKHEKSIKELFRKKCWSYLNDNFYKFKEDNRIKVALALVCKDMEKENPIGETRIIIVRPDLIEPKKESNLIPETGREIILK